jgi:hypothetical protein
VGAENIITAYLLTPGEAATLRAETVGGAGKDSPFKKDASAKYGAWHKW